MPSKVDSAKMTIKTTQDYSEPTEQRDSRYLPTELHGLFAGPKDYLVSGIFNAMARYAPFVYPDEKFFVARSENAPSLLASPVASLTFLEFLVAVLQPMRILEIGTYVGLSALYMASTLPSGGQITTLEKYPRFADIARNNFTANGKDNVIRCITGDAWETLSTLEAEAQPFDFMFLDGDKERYADYFPRLAQLLRVGGLLVVDNAFFYCDVLNDPPVTEKGAGVLRFLEVTRGLKNWRRCLLPFVDGLVLMHKMSE